ncbi:MAG: hypothetical protein JST54_09310 [Deltaproteobacteria bacterium]|nr:hypothetical protein [Deltaproteobacteria bacterium]
MGAAFSSSPTKPNLQLGEPSQGGDLVVVEYDGDQTAGDVNISVDALQFTAQKLGPFGYPDGGTGGVQTAIWWGIIGGPAGADAGIISISLEPSHARQFADLSIATYRGGRADAGLVDMVIDSGDGPYPDGGPMTCGPVATEVGGLAFFVDVMWGGGDSPLNPAFVIRQNNQGNPTGDAVPTDGSMMGTQLGCCAGFAQWVCQTISISP